MNLQSWALDWQNRMRNKHMVEPLTIVHAGGVIPLNGSVIEPESQVNSQGVRIITDTTLFIFNTVDLEGIKLQRGVRIYRRNKVYEVIIDRDKPAYYDDPNHLNTVVTAKIHATI